MYRTAACRMRPAAWLGLLILIPLCGCATVRTISNPHQEDRLERLRAILEPHTEQPSAHYWMRIAAVNRSDDDFWVFHDHHIYFSSGLIERATDDQLIALLAHGIARQELQHFGKQSIARATQYIAFLVGGAFVPGLSLGAIAVDPILQAGMKHSQEFAADVKALTYLEPMGYTVTDYVASLQLLSDLKAERRRRRTGAHINPFAERIAAVRRYDELRHTSSK